jgi:hypothetical protein
VVRCGGRGGGQGTIILFGWKARRGNNEGNAAKTIHSFSLLVRLLLCGGVSTPSVEQVVSEIHGEAMDLGMEWVL